MRSVSPSSRTTIAVSPMMRLMPSVTPVAMFERTLGSSTRRIVAMRVLPSAKAASRMCAGTACRPSRVAVNIGGSAISDIIAPGREERAPVHAAAGGRERERREDAAAGRSPGRTARSRCRASPRRSRCSTRRPAPASAGPPVLDDPHRAARPPAGRRARCRSAVSSGGPEQRVEEAARAGLRWCRPAGG